MSFGFGGWLLVNGVVLVTVDLVVLADFIVLFSLVVCAFVGSVLVFAVGCLIVL